MTKQTKYSPEVRERAVLMVLTHQNEYPSQWAAICSIATLIWMDWFDHRRLLSSIGNIPSAEVEAIYDAQAAKQKQAA
jgi:putative transposase